MVNILVVPILTIVFTYWAIGGHPIGLKLAVTGPAVELLKDCSNVSNVHFNKSKIFNTCEFLMEIRRLQIELIIYDQFERAYRDAKKGKVSGIIDVDLETNTTDLDNDNRIDVYLDQTNYPCSEFLGKRLFLAYQNFSENLMTRYNLPRRLRNVPINFETPIYGSFLEDSRNFMAAFIFQQLV